VNTSGERVVLGLQAENDGFEISNAAAEPLIVVEKAVVATDVPKESLGHGCLPPEQPVTAARTASEPGDVGAPFRKVLAGGSTVQR